jgi:predicted site-specific integrase-resolvase
MNMAAALLAIPPRTLRAWDVQGKTRVARTPGGKRRVPEREIRHLQGEGVVGGRGVPSDGGAKKATPQKDAGNG